MDQIDLRVDAILLVDAYSRLNCKIEIQELRRFGVDLISDLKDVLNLDYEAKVVVILEGFLQNPHAISDLVLHQQLLGLRYIFLGSDELNVKQLEPYAKIFTVNTDTINYTLMAAVVHDDPEAQDLFKIESATNMINLAKIVAETNTFSPEIREMASTFVRTSEEYLLLSEKYRSVAGRLEAAESLNINKDEQLVLLSEQLDNVFRQTIKVNQSLKDYSFLCSPDVYTKVDLKSYRTRPNILYFKEFGEFLCLKSFIFILAEALKTQFSLPVKVLWVLDNKVPLRLRGLPEYYTVFADGVFTRPDIQASDYMVTTSGYESILQVICENQVGLEILIVVDSKLANDTILDMRDVLRYDLCRDHRKIKLYGLNDARTICNGVGDERDLSWDYLYEYDDLDESDRFLYFAGRPVIESLVKTMRHEFGL